VGAEVMTDMTDKQIRRAILRVNTGLTEQILKLNESDFRLMKTQAGWHVSISKYENFQREYVANWSQIPTVEAVRQAIDIILAEEVVDS
jgi:hypothetical protein